MSVINLTSRAASRFFQIDLECGSTKIDLGLLDPEEANELAETLRLFADEISSDEEEEQ